MKHRLLVYKTCVGAVFASATAYRADFLLGMCITFFSNVLFPLVTVLIYQNGAAFPGWTMWEVLLIQSVYSMSVGVASMLFHGVVWSTMDYIREGSFEVVLLKPLSPLFYLSAVHFDSQSLGLLAGGAVMTAVSVSQVDGVTALGWGQFILLFLAGVAVLCGTFLMMAALTFKWVGNSRIPEMFDSVRSFGKYPLSIFPKGIAALASFLIPVGMIGFFPAEALLGKADWTAFAAMVPCGIFLLAGVWLYNKMIKLYEGVGG